MRAGALIFVGILSGALSSQAQGDRELKWLYEARRWAELYDRLQLTDGSPLYRGAAGITFHHNLPESERLLLSLIKARPTSTEAYEALEWLSHLYFYQGRYGNLESVMEKRWTTFPQKPERAQEQVAIAGFRGLPNQRTESIGPSTLTHEPDSVFLPVSINGRPANYFFDTGAWISCMSESEAARLGLEVRETSGSLGQSAGSRVRFRTAVASRVALGNDRFLDVSFAVFPDDQEPWSALAPGKRGIIGIPILLELETIRWERAGTLQVSSKPGSFISRQSNLRLDNDHLVTTASVEGRVISATVDTGALTTDLYKPFADMFPDLLKRYGSKDTTEVRGVGHAATFDSVTLKRLEIKLGGANTLLSPAHVLLKSIGAKCCVGNFGMDLFKQGPAFELDFGAMTLKLAPQRRSVASVRSGQ